MAAEAFAALGSGWLFDRTRGGVLLGLPFVISAVQSWRLPVLH
jgi:hypothetical protein